MIRSVLSLLCLVTLQAGGVSAFSNPAFLAKQHVVRTAVVLTSSVNTYVGDVKMDYSGPNLMVGMPDVAPTHPKGSSSGGSMTLAGAGEPEMKVEDLIEMEDEESYKGYAEIPSSTNQIKRSGRWVTAVFWSDLNLYGNILS